jgi:hypothetical protein
MHLMIGRAFGCGFAVAVSALLLGGCAARPEARVARSSSEKPAFAAAEEFDPEGLSDQIDRLYSKGRFAEAIPFATRLLTRRERTLGPEHPDPAGHPVVVMAENTEGI